MLGWVVARGLHLHAAGPVLIPGATHIARRIGHQHRVARAAQRGVVDLLRRRPASRGGICGGIAPGGEYGVAHQPTLRRLGLLPHQREIACGIGGERGRKRRAGEGRAVLNLRRAPAERSAAALGQKLADGNAPHRIPALHPCGDDGLLRCSRERRACGGDALCAEAPWRTPRLAGRLQRRGKHRLAPGSPLLPCGYHPPLRRGGDHRVVGIGRAAINGLRGQPAQRRLLPMGCINGGVMAVGLLPDHGDIARGVGGELGIGGVAGQRGLIEPLRGLPRAAIAARRKYGVATVYCLKPHDGEAPLAIRRDGGNARRPGLRPLQVDGLRAAPDLRVRVEARGQNGAAARIVLKPHRDKATVGRCRHLRTADGQIDFVRGVAVVDLHGRTPCAARGGEAAAHALWRVQQEGVGGAADQGHRGLEHCAVARGAHQATNRSPVRGEQQQAVCRDGGRLRGGGEAKPGRYCAGHIAGAVGWQGLGCALRVHRTRNGAQRHDDRELLDPAPAHHSLPMNFISQRVRGP